MQRLAVANDNSIPSPLLACVQTKAPRRADPVPPTLASIAALDQRNALDDAYIDFRISPETKSSCASTASDALECNSRATPRQGSQKSNLAHLRHGASLVPTSHGNRAIFSGIRALSARSCGGVRCKSTSKMERPTQ